MRRMPGPLVVQKYGGSSVAGADRIKRVARRVARERAAGHDLVVVVSAMGDTTDELLGLAAAITDEPDPRELDVLLATGEHQSATLVSMALHAMGVPAISLTGPQAGITTDGTYGRARIAGVEPRRITAEIESGKVVIVAGFQGQSAEQAHEMELTTLGRGGSDTTAVALAAALRADRCQIFTDVRGIFTADPRLVPTARQLPIIGYEEMLELAHQGAQVMQVRAVELGWINSVVIEVLSSFEDAPGTLIKEDPLVEQRNKVRGLAHDRNVAKVTVVAVPDRPGIARAIFEPLASAGVNVDMIVQNVGHGGETDLSFTVPQVELVDLPVVQEELAVRTQQDGRVVDALAVPLHDPRAQEHAVAPRRLAKSRARRPAGDRLGRAGRGRIGPAERQRLGEHHHVRPLRGLVDQLEQVRAVRVGLAARHVGLDHREPEGQLPSPAAVRGGRRSAAMR